MRLVSFQYEMAMRKALNKQWITQKEYDDRPQYGNPSPDWKDRLQILRVQGDKREVSAIKLATSSENSISSSKPDSKSSSKSGSKWSKSNSKSSKTSSKSNSNLNVQQHVQQQVQQVPSPAA